MKRLLDQSNPLMRALSKLFDIGWLSILWFLCSIPIVTIGASTTALYYTTVKVLRRDRSYVSTEFFHCFKENFLSSTILWLLFAAVMILFGFNVNMMRQQSGTTSGYLMGVYFAIALVLLCIYCYVFPVLSRFVLKRTKILRLSFYMAFRHIIYTIVFVIILAAAVVGIYFSTYFPVALLVIPGGMCWIYSLLMELLLKKYMPKQEPEVREDGEEVTEWYNE